MRVAIVRKSFHPNNAGMISGLLDAGHAVTVIVQHAGGTKTASGSVNLEPEILPYSDRSVQRYGHSKKLLDRRGLPKTLMLFRMLRDFRPDVVIVKDVRAVSIIGVQLARVLGAKPILLSDKPVLARKWPLLAIIAPLVLPKRKIHLSALGEIGHFSRLGGLLGSSLLSTHPIKEWNGGLIPRKRDEPVRIVSVGSLDNHRKRLDWIADALHEGGIANVVEVTHIGLGSEASYFFKEVRRREQKHGLPRSRFLFNVPHAQVLDLLHSFDILAHPAPRCLADVVVPEAMMHGVIPICSRRCGTHVCFKDGISGLTFEPNSKSEFIEKLTRAVRNLEEREQMRSAAVERARLLFTPQAWVTRLERMVSD